MLDDVSLLLNDRMIDVCCESCLLNRKICLIMEEGARCVTQSVKVRTLLVDMFKVRKREINECVAERRLCGRKSYEAV